LEFVYLVGAIVILIAVTVVPVMIAAKWARARRSGFLEALAAVVLATLAAQAAVAFIEPAVGALAVALIAHILVYSWVLGTNFVAAIGVAVVAVVLQVVIVTGLLALGLQWPGTAAIGPAL